MVAAVTHTPLRPRPIRHEPTPEQLEQEGARARRRALHLSLHDLFLPPVAPEDTFGGKMNLPPEKSESEIGCSLTDLFVDWLGDHRVSDSHEDRRRRRLFSALVHLSRCRPDLSLIVVEHARTHVSYATLAQRWHTAPATVSQAHAEGLDLILGWLGQDG